MLDACIIGAPKCGTSSLFRWLTAHPDIAGPASQKELFFFMDSGHPLIEEPNIHSASREAYADLFPDTTTKRRIEGTTHYLYQDAARKHLAPMDSAPLIIAVLREPARRVFSSFQYTRNNLARMDPSLSFHRYVDWTLRGEDKRLANYIDHSGSVYVLSRDVEYSAYVEHLLPWRNAVGDDRLMITTFDVLTEDPQAICQRVATRLGVDEDFYDSLDFRSRNATYRPVDRSLQSWAMTINQYIPDGPLTRVAKRAYKHVATRSRTSDRTDEDEHALERLRSYYAPYNERLAYEFDVSVDQWK